MDHLNRSRSVGRESTRVSGMQAGARARADNSNSRNHNESSTMSTDQVAVQSVPRHRRMQLAPGVELPNPWPMPEPFPPPSPLCLSLQSPPSLGSGPSEIACSPSSPGWDHSAGGGPPEILGLLSQANQRATQAEDQARAVAQHAHYVAVQSVAASQLDADNRVDQATQQLNSVVVSAQHQHLQSAQEVASIRQQSQAQINQASAAVAQTQAAAAQEVSAVKQHAERVFQEKTVEIVTEAQQVISVERAANQQLSQTANDYQQQCAIQARQIEELKTTISSVSATVSTLKDKAGPQDLLIAQPSHPSSPGVAACGPQVAASTAPTASMSGVTACGPQTAASTASFGHNGTDQRTQDVTFSSVPPMSADPSSAEQNERRSMINMIGGAQQFRISTKAVVPPRRSKSHSRYDRVQVTPPRSSSVVRFILTSPQRDSHSPVRQSRRGRQDAPNVHYGEPEGYCTKCGGFETFWREEWSCYPGRYSW